MIIPADLTECGDSAIRVVGRSPDADLNWRFVHHVANWFNEAANSEVRCVVPTYDSVLIEFDGARTDPERVFTLARSAMGTFDGTAGFRSPRSFSVPVVYGGEYGPDLARVAAFLDLTEEQVVELHAGVTYTIRCLGAPAGSPMTDGPAFAVPIPRLESPRPMVAAGHVSVAGRQATMTPVRAPGGWSLLGRTPLRVLDPSSAQLVPYRPGDTISYFAIDEGLWSDYAGQQLAGRS